MYVIHLIILLNILGVMIDNKRFVLYCIVISLRLFGPRLREYTRAGALKKILKFELYCFLLELSCFLPIHDIFPCFMFVLYISILHKGEQLVPFKFVVVFFLYIAKKNNVCFLFHTELLMRH
jgi:hypothetical protein